MISGLFTAINALPLDATTPSSNAGGAGGFLGCGTQGYGIIIIYVLIFAALYFFLIRPNSKKKKQEEELKKNVNVGDDITTIGGITGKIVAVKDEDDEVILETGADRLKLRMKRWCIYSNNTAIAAQEAEKKRIADEKAKAKADKKAGKGKVSKEKKDKNNQL